MGDTAKAAEAWSRGGAAVQGGGGRRGGGAGGAGAQAYYQALCLRKSGQTEKAASLLQSLVQTGQSQLRTLPTGGGGRGGFGRPQSARLRQANGHYLTGLGYLGLNEPQKAKAEFSQAVDASPDLLGARTALATLR
jgi:tetratricopeptide (TPR) repeat protein